MDRHARPSYRRCDYHDGFPYCRRYDCSPSSRVIARPVACSVKAVALGTSQLLRRRRNFHWMRTVDPYKYPGKIPRSFLPEELWKIKKIKKCHRNRCFTEIISGTKMRTSRIRPLVDFVGQSVAFQLQLIYLAYQIPLDILQKKIQYN